MTRGTKTIVLLLTTILGFGLVLGASETPEECCQWKNTDSVPDRCTSVGLFPSKSKCFINSIGMVTDRSDYFKCTKCGSVFCMARLKCPQPCLPYLNGASCDCWNYFNPATATCTNTPTTTLAPCEDSTTDASAST